jgi:hypothetical protein
MSRGKWKRDGLTHLPRGRLEDLPREWLRRDGTFNVRHQRDCNVFIIKSVMALIGATNQTRFVLDVLCDKDFAHYPIKTIGGALALVATHTDSATAYANKRRAKIAAARTARLHQFRRSFDLQTK